MTTNPVFLLKENDIDIWISSFDQFRDDIPVSDYKRLLTCDELKRLDSIVRENHRIQYLVSRALLRTVLNKYTAIPPASIKFSYNKYGKPYLNPAINRHDIEFNLSHSNGIAVCAITAKREVGIDIEKLRIVGNIKSITDKFFSPYEAKNLIGNSANHNSERIIEYWTLKEAYVKAMGYGMYMPLNSVIIDYENECTINCFNTGVDNSRLHHNKFFLFDMPLTYKLSICINCKQSAPNFNITAREIVPFKSGRKINFNLIRQSI